MPRLTGEAFTNATQTVPVTFLAGREGGALQIPKGLLQHWSEPLAELAEANDDLIRLADEELATVRAFHHWILKDHLPPILNNLTEKQRPKRTKTFINLWLFGSRYLIQDLQVVTLRRLAILFENPHNLRLTHIRYIWENTSSDNSPLRTLAALVIVRRVKEPRGNAKKWKFFGTEQGLDGMMVKLLTAADKWHEFQATKLRKKGPSSPWMVFYDQLVEDGSMAFYREVPEAQEDTVVISDDEE